MIDDLTIAARVDGIDGVPDGMLPLDTVRGRPEVFGTSQRDGQLFITYCPETQIVTVRISVPRWMHRGPVNFPLVPLRSVKDLHPSRIAYEVGAALGASVSSIGDDGLRRFPIHTWAVIRVSFAADLVVGDPIASLYAYRGIDRRHAGRFTTFGRPTSTVQWGSRSLRVKLYAKGVEIQSHRSKDEELAQRIAELAASATKVLRFEASYLQARGVRDLFDIGNKKLPTLAVVCDPRVSAWALTRQADRLRLMDDYSDVVATSVPERVRHIGAILLEGQRSLAASGGALRLGRRKTLTPERVWDLAALHLLGSGYTLGELAELSGKSRSALAEMLAELRELGIPSDISTAGAVGAAIEEIKAQLEAHLLPSYPPDLSDWSGRGALVDPPWETERVPEPDEDDDYVSF